MRKLCRSMGASLTFTEMISAKGLYYNDRKTEKLLFMYEDELPVGIQIFGREPDMIAFAAEKLEDRPSQVLDINMGCPVPKIVKNGEGSALLKEPDLVEKLVRAAVDHTKKPVTAKIRIGFGKDDCNAVEVAKAVEAGGASAVTVHGRTRAQMYSGSARWDVIADVKKAVGIPVVGNGDVTDAKAGIRMMEETGCDMVMVARGALGNPWIFRDLNCLYDLWQKGEYANEGPACKDYGITPPTLEERKTVLLSQLQELSDLKGEHVAVMEMRKICSWYIKGLPGSADFRRSVNKVTEAGELRKLISAL